MLMPFGKYKGFHIENIPISYLAWLIDSDSINDYRLKSCINNELKIRLTDDEFAPEKDIRRIYYELCNKYHPDKGGSEEAMKAINEFYSLLKTK